MKARGKANRPGQTEHKPQTKEKQSNQLHLSQQGDHNRIHYARQDQLNKHKYGNEQDETWESLAASCHEPIQRTNNTTLEHNLHIWWAVSSGSTLFDIQ